MDRETVVVIGLVLGVTVALALPIGLGLLAYRRIQSAAQRSLSTLLENVSGRSPSSIEPQVDVLCYAYYGFLATLTTVKIECRLPPEHALELLDRVHRFNLRWGWLAAGGIFVPLASLWRWTQQRRSIQSQLKRT